METFEKVDLSLPRYRAKSHEVDDVNFFKALCKKVPKAKELGHSKVKKLIQAFNESITDVVIDNREGVELLEGIGYIFIIICKSS